MATLSCLWGRQLLLGASLLGGSALGAAAQTLPDTTRLRYSEEAATPSVGPATQRVQEAQRSLWKLGLNNFLPYTDAFGEGTYYARLGLHLAYERKLRDPAWSVLAEVSPAIARYRPDAAAERRQEFSLQAQVAGRYYYNRERRLLQGKNVGNFSANYVGVALGAGLGRTTHETPFFLYRERQLAVADAALLYGLQRRLGRYGFLDVNLGLATLLTEQPCVTLVSSLRVGLTLGPQPAPYTRHLVPAGEVKTLLPRFYVGTELGGTFYRVRYSDRNPYPAPSTKQLPTESQVTYYPVTYRDGYGTYAQYVSAGPVPYVYAGYYLAPRLALQLGFQYGETFADEPVGTVFTSPDGSRLRVPNQTLRERGLALPVVLRYSLTPDFRRRLQFDALGGLVPLWSSVAFREYAIVNHELTTQETFGFERRAFGLHATLGLDAGYAFGRRRRVQATTGFTVNKDVRTITQPGRSNQQDGSFLAGGWTFGLRYRFGYH